MDGLHANPSSTSFQDPNYYPQYSSSLTSKDRAATSLPSNSGPGQTTSRQQSENQEWSTIDNSVYPNQQLHYPSTASPFDQSRPPDIPWNPARPYHYDQSFHPQGSHHHFPHDPNSNGMLYNGHISGRLNRGQVITPPLSDAPPSAPAHHHAVGGPSWMPPQSIEMQTAPRRLPLESSSRLSPPAEIRKKNAKIDISPEHNLSNLDKLIKDAQALGENDKVKTLKQEKRLLRNREAALHSRQKKKLHTERLEKVKAEYEAKMHDMQNRMDSLVQENQMLRNREWNINQTEFNLPKKSIDQLDNAQVPLGQYGNAGNVALSSGQMFDNSLSGPEGDNDWQQEFSTRVTPAVLGTLLLVGAGVITDPTSALSASGQISETLRNGAHAVLTSIHSLTRSPVPTYAKHTIQATIDAPAHGIISNLASTDAIRNFKRIFTQKSRK